MDTELFFQTTEIYFISLGRNLLQVDDDRCMLKKFRRLLYRLF